MSAFVMPEICELFTRSAAHKYLAEGRIVLLGGGTGNPLLHHRHHGRAAGSRNRRTRSVLKATKVDGVYSADPKKDPSRQAF